MALRQIISDSEFYEGTMHSRKMATEAAFYNKTLYSLHDSQDRLNA